MGTYVFQLRRDDSVDWERKNPILRDGEPGYETDTNRLKIGDGLTRWNDLHYISGGTNDGTSMDLTEHIEDPTPHLAYDDGPSFALIYQNAKV